MEMWKDSGERETVMNMTSIFNLIWVLFLMGLASCGSGKIVPTKDVCTVERHYKDHIYQVKINEEPVSAHWYIKEDAIEIAQNLAKKNKCKAWQ